MASGGANNAQHTTAYLVSGHRIWTTRERPQEIGQHQSGSQDLVYGSWDIGFRGHGILPLGIRGSIQYSAYNCVSSFGSRELDYMGLAGALATSKQVTGLGIHELWVTGFM